MRCRCYRDCPGELAPDWTRTSQFSTPREVTPNSLLSVLNHPYQNQRLLDEDHLQIVRLPRSWVCMRVRGVGDYLCRWRRQNQRQTLDAALWQSWGGTVVRVEKTRKVRSGPRRYDASLALNGWRKRLSAHRGFHYCQSGLGGGNLGWWQILGRRQCWVMRMGGHHHWGRPHQSKRKHPDWPAEGSPRMVMILNQCQATNNWKINWHNLNLTTIYFFFITQDTFFAKENHCALLRAIITIRKILQEKDPWSRKQ